MRIGIAGLGRMGSAIAERRLDLRAAAPPVEARASGGTVMDADAAAGAVSIVPSNPQPVPSGRS